MSTFNRDRFRKKLHRLLAEADDEGFFEMMWAVNALQTERESLAKKYLEFPAEAASSDKASKYAIHAWELESLIGQLLVTPKESKKGRNLNCKNFSAAIAAVNNLRAVENAESAIYLKRVPILLELHRIGQRQFPWQRGYLNLPQFYRFAYIFGGDLCSAYFKEKNGLTLNELSLAGLAYYMAFQEHPNIARQYSLNEIGIDAATKDHALALLSTSISDAKQKNQTLLRPTVPSAYQPNVLRQCPVVAFGSQSERLRSPLPQLILLRITAGIYYDLVSGPANLRNEASERFENYCAGYIKASMPQFDVKRDTAYQCQNGDVRSPDIRIERDGRIILVAECKASKLTFAAQFADDPLVEAKVGYEEISKGVFQLWRYFSHARRGLVDANRVDKNAYAMLLTSDTWLTMANELQEGVIARATELANEDSEISPVDRKHIIFCAIQDLENTLAISDEEVLLKTLSAAREEKYAGWILWNVRKDIDKSKITTKPFPFELGNVLPWWTEIEKRAVEQGLIELEADEPAQPA